MYISGSLQRVSLDPVLKGAGFSPYIRSRF
jgi:hypothetical protein